MHNRHPEDLLNPVHRDFPEIFFLCYQALEGARYEKIRALCHNKHVARVVLDEAQLLLKVSTILSLGLHGLHVPYRVVTYLLLGYAVSLSSGLQNSSSPPLAHKPDIPSHILPLNTMDYPLCHPRSQPTYTPPQNIQAWLMYSYSRSRGSQEPPFCHRTYFFSHHSKYPGVENCICSSSNQVSFQFFPYMFLRQSA